MAATMRRCDRCGAEFEVTDVSPQYPAGTWAACPACREKAEAAILAGNLANMRRVYRGASYSTVAEAQAAQPAPAGFRWATGLSEAACEYCRAGKWVGHDHPECQQIELERDTRY